MSKLLSISEVSKLISLVDPVTKKPLNHILRYWENEFKEIKPKKINNRRYYSLKQIEIIKMINFLLKNKGFTIKGAKRLLNEKRNNLDHSNNNSLKREILKMVLKQKTKLLLEKIDTIKNYGKKNTS